jgi:hypothetical protein
MTHYFLQLRNGADVALDDDGSDFASEASLCAAMLLNARGIMSHDVLDGGLDLTLRIDAETADRHIVRSLSFVHALQITYPVGNLS